MFPRMSLVGIFNLLSSEVVGLVGHAPLVVLAHSLTQSLARWLAGKHSWSDSSVLLMVTGVITGNGPAVST